MANICAELLGRLAALHVAPLQSLSCGESEMGFKRCDWTTAWLRSHWRQAEVCVCVHIACLRSGFSFCVSALHNREMDPRSPYFSYMPLHYLHIVFYILKIKKVCKDGQKTSRAFDGRQKQTWSWTRWCGINKSMWNPLDLNAKKVLTSAKENARRPLFYIKTHWHCIPLQLLWQVVKFSDEQFGQRDILQGQTKKGHPHKRS